MDPVTRERVNVRAHELAVIAGRAPPHVTQADYEQAKREVTGESDINRQEAMLESVLKTEGIADRAICCFSAANNLRTIK